MFNKSKLKSDIACAQHYGRDMFVGTVSSGLVGFFAAHALHASPAFTAAAIITCATAATIAISQRFKNASQRLLERAGNPLSELGTKLLDSYRNRTIFFNGIQAIPIMIATLQTEQIIDQIQNPSHFYQGASKIIEWGLPLTIAGVASLGFLGASLTTIDRARRFTKSIVGDLNVQNNPVQPVTAETPEAPARITVQRAQLSQGTRQIQAPR